MHRRELLRTAPFLLAGSLGSPLAARAGRAGTKGASRMRTAICAYSFRTPLESKALTYADLVRMAVEQEIDGLDLTVYWFPSTEGRFPAAPQAAGLPERGGDLQHLDSDRPLPAHAAGAGSRTSGDPQVD